MHRIKTGTILFVLSFLIVILHMEGMRREWYFFYPWYDIPMHFLGGLVVAFLIYFIILTSGKRSSVLSNRLKLGVYIIVGTLVIGIGWELFEYFFNITFDAGQTGDTMLDIVMDIVGALVVYTYALVSLRKNYSDESKRKALEYNV